MTLDWRQNLIEDEHWWKKTFEGRQPLKEDSLPRKITFDGRQVLKEDTHKKPHIGYYAEK